MVCAIVFINQQYHLKHENKHFFDIDVICLTILFFKFLIIFQQQQIFLDCMLNTFLCDFLLTTFYKNCIKSTALINPCFVWFSFRTVSNTLKCINNSNTFFAFKRKNPCMFATKKNGTQ